MTMKNRQREMKWLYLTFSVLGIAYFVLSVIALFAGGAMHGFFFSDEMDSTGNLLFLASMLFWWVSIQLYLRSLPEPKLPDWAKKLCVANILVYLGVLLLRLAEIYLL